MSALPFDIRRILETVPHRYPFLLVDRITEFEELRRAVGFKNVTANEPWCQGHFPGSPVMPAVLVVEAMAQVGAALLLASIPNRERYYVYLAGVDRARFRRPVIPGDQLRLELEVLQVRLSACRMKGTASVEGERVAEAELLASRVERPSGP
jgi:beta-hydroxyacyl-ACP dehydratase FabZ